MSWQNRFALIRDVERRHSAGLRHIELEFTTRAPASATGRIRRGELQNLRAQRI